MSVPTRVQERLATIDPWLVACCLTALVVYLLHGFDGRLDRDSAVYAYGGQQVAEGVPPYVAIANRAGPLAHLIPGFGVIVSRAVGVDDLLGMRVLFMLIAIAAVGVAYLLGRDLFRSRPAGVVTAAVFLSFHGFITFATFGPREKTTMVLFLLAALLAMTHQRWLSTGVLISLATLTWQPVFFGVMAGVVVAVLLGVPRRGWLRALGRVVAGGCIPLLLTVGAYAAVGELRTFLDCFLLINASYTRQEPLLSHASFAWGNLVDGYGATFVLLLGGIVALLVAAVLAALRQSRRERLPAALIGTGVYALGAVAWTLRAYNYWMDAFVLLPAGAIGVGAVISALAVRVPRGLAVALPLGVAAACVASGVVFSVTTNRDGLDKQRESAAAALRVTPDAEIFSVQAPEPLVLTQQRNASRYQLFGNGFIDYIDHVHPGGRAGFGRWIGRQEPTLIAVGGGRHGWLAPTLEGYELVGTAPGWEWYARRDLGAGVLDELRQTLVSGGSNAQLESSPEVIGSSVTLGAS